MAILIVWSAVACPFLFAESSTVAPASPTTLPAPLESDQVEFYPQDEYCGVRCVYSLLRLAGKSANFEALLRPEYVGLAGGSTAEQVVNALRHSGLLAEPVSNLTTDSLRNSPYPMILHVRGEKSPKYSHFLLFLGTTDGKALIYDPPLQPVLKSYTEVAAMWDGAAVVVASKPIDMTTVLAPVRRQFMLGVGVISAILASAHLVRRWYICEGAVMRVGPLHAARDAVVLAGISVIVGFSYHLLRDEGMLDGARPVLATIDARTSSFLPKVDADGVREMIAAGATIIDARFPQDFAVGHIKGAINIPVDTNANDLRDAVARIPTQTNLVIYCQNWSCDFSDRLARRLLDQGYRSIAIYRAGWQDWKSQLAR